jgi:hypothetical protein
VDNATLRTDIIKVNEYLLLLPTGKRISEYYAVQVAQALGPRLAPEAVATTEAAPRRPAREPPRHNEDKRPYIDAGPGGTGLGQQLTNPYMTLIKVMRKTIPWEIMTRLHT